MARARRRRPARAGLVRFALLASLSAYRSSSIRDHQPHVLPGVGVHGGRPLDDVGLRRHSRFGQTAFFGLSGLHLRQSSRINFGDVGFGPGSRSPRALLVTASSSRPDRLFHVLWWRERRVRRHRHAVGDAGARNVHVADRRSAMGDRCGAAERLQRHGRHAAAHDPLAATNPISRWNVASLARADPADRGRIS